MIIWPTVALTGFGVLAALVIVLGTSSTARYEFERNQVQSQRPGQRQQAAVPVAAGAAQTGAAVPPAAEPARAAGSAGVRDDAAELALAVGMAAHPAGARLAEPGVAPAWWLVDETDGQVLGGPFPDRVAADWAALSGSTGAPARTVHGVPAVDGRLVRRQSPQEQAWLTQLGEQLDRLPEEWDAQLADDDAVVTLVVEVAAALVEAGLAVHDCSGSDPSGGVCLTPDPSRGGVLVSWHQHDRMSRDQVRGAAVDAAVQQTMNAAVADCLRQLGFEVESFGSAGCSLVTSAEWWW